MAILPARMRFGRGRWIDAPAAPDVSLLTATPGGSPRTPVEGFALGYLAKHGATSRSELVTAVRSWIARCERGAGGGVGDLGFWGDGMWHEDAVRAVARMEDGLVRAASGGE